MKAEGEVMECCFFVALISSLFERDNIQFPDIQ